MQDRTLDDVTGEVVDAAMKLHGALGPGLLESVYETILARDLERRGLGVIRQHAPSFDYDGLHFAEAFRIDLLVQDRVVVEIKSTDSFHPVYAKQVLTYLRLMGLPVGLLLNFGAPTMKEGLRRIVNNLSPGETTHLRVNQQG
jgi:GxxExxY protein